MKKGCYAVIFSNQMKAIDDVFYQQLSKSLRKLAQDQKGYLGLETYRNEDGAGVTISYWETKEAIAVWKKNSEHLVAQHYGRQKAYDHYSVQVCEVMRSYHHTS